MLPRRLLVVVAAYLLSFFGFALMLTGALGALTNGTNPVRLLPLLWLYAWVCHIRMSYAWICDQVLPRRWPLRGTLAGVASLFSMSAVVWADKTSPPIPLQHHLVMPAMMGIFFLPCIALAVHLVRFHWRAGPDDGR